MSMLEEIVSTDEKQRYSFNEDKTLIRANQGHSVSVDVELSQKIPPEILYHGTGEKYVSSIEKQGLIPKSRLYVHLSADYDTAVKVGARHGKPVVYLVSAGDMQKNGYVFYQSVNGVWLTKSVPVEFLQKEKRGENMKIRYATKEDIAAVAAVEAACFPPAEAAKEADFVERVTQYGNHFWLMFDGAKLIAFADGFVTDEADLTDDMYHDASMHNENGTWQMIFGVNTIPVYRRRGFAETLLRRAIEDARKQGRKGLVLTCKDALVSYYAKFGFRDEGISEKSTHGNVVWHQMRLQF